VAVTLVEMDLDLPGVKTALNLERALAALAPRLARGTPGADA
jgi:hypothetical protein